MAAQVLNQ